MELEHQPQSEPNNAATSSSIAVSQPSELLAPSIRKRKRNADIPVTILEDAIVIDQVQVPGVAANETVLPVEKENAPPLAPVSTAIVAEPPMKATARRKKRKSIGQRRKKRTSASSTEEFTIVDEEEEALGEENEEVTVSVDDATATTESNLNLILDEAEANIVGVDAEDERLDEEQSDEAEEREQDGSLGLTQVSSTTTTIRPRRKRKSIAQQKKKKKRTSADSLNGIRQPLEPAETPFRRYDSDEDKSDYLPEDVESSPVVQRKKKQQLQQPAAKRKPRAWSHEESRIAASDERSTHRHDRSNSTDASKQEGAKSAGIPIIVHRMTNRDALPTIREETSHSINSDNEEEDEVARDRKRPKPSSPNAVDVVAQLCRETIESRLLNLTDSSTSTSRSTLTHKRNAISTFGSNLDTRLLDLSQTLDSHHTLLARLKQSKRLRSDLQNEWLDLRKQREEIALRSDDIRRRNTEAEVEAREALALHESLGSLEMSVERTGQGEGEKGLEYLLKIVAENTCDRSDGEKGLLGEIKEFNGVLERTIMVMEGRM